MPELPEVETIRRSLEPHVVGRRFASVEAWDPLAIRYPEDAARFADRLVGRRIERLSRRGKYFMARLAPRGLLVAHLRMSGRLHWHPAPEEPERFARLRLHLDDGSCLDYLDMRRLGGVYLPEADGAGTPKGLVELGPEPLSAAFTADVLAASARSRRTSIKALLLDQRVVAGLGNIYVDEALHRARLHPARFAAALTPHEMRVLHRAVRAVLRDGLAMRGVSFSLYRDGLGRRGEMTEHLRVYGRAGEPCLVCGGPVHRMRLAGRGTSFCPSCQRLPEEEGPPLAPSG